MQTANVNRAAAILASFLAGYAGPAAAGSNPFKGLQLNGNATVTASGSLSLVTGFEQASSAYVKTPFALSPTFSFTSTFSVRADKLQKGPQADGFAFVMQNDPAGALALGSDGACLAICNIRNYAAIALLSYYNDTVGLWLNGNASTQPFRTGYYSKENLDVTVTYNQMNTTLAFTAFNEKSGATVSGSYNVDLSTLGSSLYIGFTGGSGSEDSNESVENWSFQSTP